MSYEPISVYGNYFVGIDGEGVGDDYVLLDSSVSDYPRLYTGKRLTTLECLDWLWGLAKYAGYTFVLFGARYDYDNWMRDIPFEDVKRYAAGQPVRVADYLIVHQERFKFEIRKIQREDITKPEYSPERYHYERVRTRSIDMQWDYTGVKFWDIQPFWQTTFVKSLEMTFKDKERIIERALIEEGKEARGTFTHENIEWVSRYNKAECQNLAWMGVELDHWFQQAGIKPLHYNGPGSAAKAMFRTHAPYLHAGRRIANTAKVSAKVREYIFPGADNPHTMLTRAMSAYAGGLNRQLKIGYHPGNAHQYDIISAYPFAMLQLPCLSHGHWERTHTFDRRSFGLWQIRYKASRHMELYPFFWRLPDGSIEYPFAFDNRWVHTAELAAGLAIDSAGIVLLDGWKWIPSECDNPYPLWWIAQKFALRQHYKKIGNEGGSNGLKLPLNSAYGSIAQARGGTASNPPWTQQLLWAGAITAYTRARLYLAYSTNPNSIVHMATDGIISIEPLNLRLGEKLGEWEHTNLMDLTCVQYGVYAGLEWEEKDGDIWAIPRHRERGFTLKDDEVSEFVNRVHNMWATGTWTSLEIQQKLFVSAKLVAMSEKRYEEWCTWQQQTKTIELDQASIFKMGHVDGVPGMWPIQDASHNLQYLGTSTAYKPKWGKGEDFPLEWKKEDVLDEALQASTA